MGKVGGGGYILKSLLYNDLQISLNEALLSI